MNGLAVLKGIAQPGSFPSNLKQELQTHKSPIVTHDTAQCRQLLLQPPKNHIAWM